MPDKFSWAAFVLTWVWALWNRMWIVAVLALSLMFIASALPAVPQFLLSLGVSILMGLHGNDLLGWSLTRRGLSEIGQSNGDSLEEAELRFYVDGIKTSTVASHVPVDHDTLGLFGVRS